MGVAGRKLSSFDEQRLYSHGDNGHKEENEGRKDDFYHT